MNTHCPECGVKFEREPGYFLGALVFSYFISVAMVVPTLVLLVFALQYSLGATVALASLQVLVLSPFVFKYSRLTWLHFDAQGWLEGQSGARR